jgi:hypothetical protein
MESATWNSRNREIYAIVDAAYSLVRKNKIISATDLLVDQFDRSLQINNFDFTHRLLDELDCKKLSSEVITGILCITFHAKSKLGLNRKKFFEKAMHALANEFGFTEEQCNAIIIRLR